MFRIDKQVEKKLDNAIEIVGEVETSYDRIFFYNKDRDLESIFSAISSLCSSSTEIRGNLEDVKNYIEDIVDQKEKMEEILQQIAEESKEDHIVDMAEKGLN